MAAACRICTLLADETAEPGGAVVAWGFEDLDAGEAASRGVTGEGGRSAGRGLRRDLPTESCEHPSQRDGPLTPCPLLGG
jgi:hypothetical protein